MKKTLILAILSATLTLTASLILAADDHGHDHSAPPPATAPKPADPRKDPHDHEVDHDHDHAPSKSATDPHAHVDEVKLTPNAVRANKIEIATASLQKLSPRFIAPGRVVFNAEAMAHVGAAVRGRAVEVKAKIGSLVAKGDELLIVESPELGEAQSDVIQKRIALEILDSAIEPSKDSYDRAKKLFDQNEGIPLTEVQKRLADYRAAQGAALSAKSAFTAAENKLHLMGMDQKAVESLLKTSEISPKYTIRAPIAGTIISREVTQGELVNPDKDALLIIADTTTLWVWADVPESKLASVETGSLATVHTANARESWSGKVTQIATQIDATTRTGKVRMDIPNPNGALRPGMFAKVEISSPDAAIVPVLAVPEEAVIEVEGKPAVFVPVPGEKNTFAKRTVSIGKPIGGFVPIHAGLKEGEKFVTKNVFILKADLGKAGAAHEH